MVQCCTATGHHHCSEMHMKKKESEERKEEERENKKEKEESKGREGRERGRKRKEQMRIQNIPSTLHWVDIFVRMVPVTIHAESKISFVSV